MAELFLADGTVKVFDVDVDVDAYDEDEAEDSRWLVASGDLVKYGVDDDGVIDAMEAVVNGPDYTYKSVTNEKVTDKGYFDGRAIASDVLVFTFDGTRGEETDEDEDYGVTTLAKIKGNTYDDASYLVESGKITLMYIYGEGDADDEVYGVVTDWYRDSASDSGYVAIVLVDGAEVEYEITSNLYNGTGGITQIDVSEELQYFDLNSKGQIQELIAVTNTTTVLAYDAIKLSEGALDGALSGGVLTVDGDDDYTVDSDAVAYKWDDGEFVKSSVSRTNLKDEVFVILYDLDEDGVVDVVLFGASDWR